MGVSMLAVLLFHAYIAWGGLFVFKYGFIGVDSFLFLSGYGLCFSYKKNSIRSFLLRRMNRIMPKYIVYAIIATILGVTLGNKNISIWDLFCNITTLSYYNIGGWFIDWYLAALIIFYLTFPLIFPLISFRTFIVLLISASLFFIFYNIREIEWKYICFLARIPVFYLGVIMYRSCTPPTYNSLRNFSWLIIVMVCLGIFLLLMNILSIFYVTSFFLTSLCMPVFIITCWWLKKFLSNKIVHFLEFMGIESLMIYLANVFTQLFLDLVYVHNPYRLMIYIFLNVVFIGIIYKFHFKRHKT